MQEFCRVLFDAIDQSFQLKIHKKQEDEEMAEVETAPPLQMSDLYEGISQGFVRCLTCGYESVREDRYQDLSLPIRNEFGTGVLNSSVEMALENYIKPERLEGDNQYSCEQCA